MSQNAAPYKVGAVANFMIGLALRRRRPLTHLKLQKLVYMSYGIYLATTGKRLFRERIEAWRYGPVIPELYHEFKRFGRSPIRRWSADYDYQTGKFEFPLIADDDEPAILALSATWQWYAPLSGPDLVGLTHGDGTPWKDIRDRGDDTITDDLIRNHYRELIDARNRRHQRT